MKKKGWNWIYKQRWAAVIFLACIVCFVVSAFLPDYLCRQTGGQVSLEEPRSFCRARDGRMAIVDGGDVLYCTDEEENYIYALDIRRFPYKNAEFINAVFGEGGNLYCHVAVYNEDAYLTDSECIWQISPEGKPVREIVHYNYRDMKYPPSHLTLIDGMHIYEESLVYLYISNEGNRIVKVDPDDFSKVQEVAVAYEGFGTVLSCHPKPAGGFLAVYNNGEIGEIGYNGTYRTLYKASYNVRSDTGMFVEDACMTEEGLFLLTGQGNPTLYQWTETEWKPVCSLRQQTGIEPEEDIYYMGLTGAEKGPVIHINSALYECQTDGTLSPMGTKMLLPVSMRMIMMLKTILLWAGAVLALVCVVLFLKLVPWRKSILAKQLLTTIPVVLLMLLVVFVTMMASMISLNTDEILKETIAITEIAAAQFRGEELAGITGYESVDDGTVEQLNKRLREFLNGNRSSWSGNYSAEILVRTDGERFVKIASGDGSGQFMNSSIETETPIEREFYEDSNTFAASVGIGEDYKNLHLLMMTPIYNADGSYDAILLLHASQSRLIEEVVAVSERLLLCGVIWIVLLVLVIWAVSARNVKSLKRAKTVVGEIAGGDFSVRVDEYSQDETGEICAGVNDMAQRLEHYLTEKERNEKFYYKFVPEKFRELLHKENFTDLELGDAQSVDMTILFCDIRAFSLNSEMMTARESFDFVNRIYGKAGPIIRNHNGFIDKYIGDAVMALFESADDAVAAGIALYQAIVLCPDAEKEFGIPSVKIGVGIHSGMARIGIVGEQERMSGTVISNTVNLSSRMEALTKQYGAGMIISKDTLDRMENPDALSTRYLGMVQVAGVNEVAGLYEVLDCLEEETRAAREQTKTRFREAVRLFHIGEFQGALDEFAALEKMDPEDKASHLYANHIKEKLQRGDTEHHVFRFFRKE